MKQNLNSSRMDCGVVRHHIGGCISVTIFCVQDHVTQIHMQEQKDEWTGWTWVRPSHRLVGRCIHIPECFPDERLFRICIKESIHSKWKKLWLVLIKNYSKKLFFLHFGKREVDEKCFIGYLYCLARQYSYKLRKILTIALPLGNLYAFCHNHRLPAQYAKKILSYRIICSTEPYNTEKHEHIFTKCLWEGLPSQRVCQNQGHSKFNLKKTRDFAKEKFAKNG